MELTELEDVRYEIERGVAWITIDRPKRFNAFRARTVDELIRCFKAAWTDAAVGVVVLTGAGDQAFSLVQVGKLPDCHPPSRIIKVSKIPSQARRHENPD